MLDGNDKKLYKCHRIRKFSFGNTKTKQIIYASSKAEEDLDKAMESNLLLEGQILSVLIYN